MVNPIAMSGAWGLIKGLVAGRSTARQHNHFSAYVSGPFMEEAMFRLPQLSAPISSAAFAAVHLTPDMIREDPLFSAFRFGEVFAGGMMYDSAFKRYGFLGAVGAHMLHNVACTLGAILSPRPGPRAYASCPHSIPRRRHPVPRRRQLSKLRR